MRREGENMKTSMLKTMRSGIGGGAACGVGIAILVTAAGRLAVADETCMSPIRRFR